MNRTLALLIAGIVALAGLEAPAAHTHATLHLEAATAKPGETIWAAVRLQMDPEWHTYWKNAGEGGLGIPTKIIWKLPPGVTAGPIEWPVPEKLPATDATTYIFHDEAALLIPLTLASDLKPGTLELAGEVRWMECKTACIPGKTNISAKLQIGGTTEPSADAPSFKAWRDRLPKPATAELQPQASWEKPATGDKRPLLIEWTFADKADSADFYPAPAESFDVLGDTDIVELVGGKIRLRKMVQKFEGDWPKEIAGLLVMKTGTNTTALDARFSIGATETGGATAGAPSAGAPSLLLMLLYAFIGGMILNIMPCVLPVIALKILGFVNQAKESPARVRQLGLVYGAGVLVSFLVLAAFVIGLKAAGHKAGWGIQFSNPLFIVGLTVLVTLVALNLFGVFEITLGGRAMNAAGGLATQHGMSGAFFHGVLATALATPCTAPFLGVALGFAFAQPSAIIVLMFLAVGLGLAAPYVVLSWQPAWLKFLPKPGVWMERFKVAMGFPMLATAFWLASLATSFYGDRTWWLGVFLVFLGAAAWVFGEFFQRGSQRRGVAIFATLLLLIAGFAWPLEAGLRWRLPTQDAAGEKFLASAPEGYPWQRWSPEAVAKARAEGRPVIVDFTAKWCQTCNISVKPGLEARSVVEKMTELNAVALLADYTRFPPEITDELERFERRGVPLVLVYPRDATQPPIILPEPLPFPAPYAPVVLGALKKL